MATAREQQREMDARRYMEEMYSSLLLYPRMWVSVRTEVERRAVHLLVARNSARILDIGRTPQVCVELIGSN